MRRLTLFLALAAVAFALGSCDKLNPIAWMDKLLQDVDVSLSAPDKVIVTNNASISSLESFTVDIFRAGSLVYTLHIERGIVAGRMFYGIYAGDTKTFIVDDFVILPEDEADIRDMVFSYEM
ncbi:MAG: hypothetical protein MdMp014T_2675 [Treponematales bacterium]